MTQAKPLPEIARCACGSVAEIFHGYNFYVKCICGATCWFGPSCKTARGAILAWNRVMSTCRAVRNLVGRVKSAEKDYRRDE